MLGKGNSLEEFRKAKGLMQTEMASLIGVSKSYYSKIERGFREPSYSFLKKLKECFREINIDKTFFE